MKNWLGRWFLPKIPATSDQPRSFGYKTAWLALASEDPMRVANAVKKMDQRFAHSKVSKCSWEYGFQMIFRENAPPSLFLTPTINDYVVAVEYDIDWKLESIDQLLSQLSQQLDGRVCLFGSHRVSTSYYWAVAEKGKLLRAYFVGNGETMINFGQPLAEERALNLRYYEELKDIEDDDEWDRAPNEETILKLAEMLSVNPSKFEESNQLSVGLLIH